MLVDSFLHFCSVVLVLTFRQRQGTNQKSNYQATCKGKMTPWTLRTHTSSDLLGINIACSFSIVHFINQISSLGRSTCMQSDDVFDVLNKIQMHLKRKKTHTHRHTYILF